MASAGDSDQLHQQVSLLTLESQRGSQNKEAEHHDLMATDPPTRRLSHRDSITKWRDDIEVMETRLHSTSWRRSATSARRPPLMRYSERKKSGVDLEPFSDCDVTRLITGMSSNRNNAHKVHNIMAGTDIFSFRILRTIQYLVHELT